MDIDQLFDEFIEFPEGSSGNLVTTVSAKLFAKYCTEKLQEENERLLFGNRYNADMYRQIDDERKRLQAEVERLQEGDKQADFTSMNLLIEKKIQIEKLEKERDHLKAILQQFMALNQHDRDLPLELFAIQRSVSAKAVSLAVHDAEVIERLRDAWVSEKYDLPRNQVSPIYIERWLISKANQLRQQAKEVSGE